MAFIYIVLDEFISDLPYLNYGDQSSFLYKLLHIYSLEIVKK